MKLSIIHKAMLRVPSCVSGRFYTNCIEAKLSTWKSPPVRRFRSIQWASTQKNTKRLWRIRLVFFLKYNGIAYNGSSATDAEYHSADNVSSMLRHLSWYSHPNIDLRCEPRNLSITHGWGNRGQSIPQRQLDWRHASSDHHATLIVTLIPVEIDLKLFDSFCVHFLYS